jgi:DNA-binding PadR family transcriptional regulator
MELSRDAYAILGLLRLDVSSAMVGSGYSIKRCSDCFTGQFWNLDRARIDSEIDRLERLALVRREPAADEGEHDVHTVTPAGERALRDWLSGEDDLDVELRHEGVMRLFLAGALEPEQQRRLLAKVRSGHESDRAHLVQMRPQLEDHCRRIGDELPPAAVDAWIELYAGLIEICDRLEQRLESARPPVA